MAKREGGPEPPSFFAYDPSLSTTLTAPCYAGFMAASLLHSSFSTPVRAWFTETFPGPTDVQRRGWPVIAAGSHALLVAPTGSGKTLAAFLWAIDGLAKFPAGPAQPGVRVLYISPLKALVYDIERNLRAPLAGIRRAALESSPSVPPGEKSRWTCARATHRRGNAGSRPGTPVDILVTTPESLFLLLGSRARETLATVSTVIVDEIPHRHWPPRSGEPTWPSPWSGSASPTRPDPQRIALSATVRPLPEVARFLGETGPWRWSTPRHRPSSTSG